MGFQPQVGQVGGGLTADMMRTLAGAPGGISQMPLANSTIASEPMQKIGGSSVPSEPKWHLPNTTGLLSQMPSLLKNMQPQQQQQGGGGAGRGFGELEGGLSSLMQLASLFAL